MQILEDKKGAAMARSLGMLGGMGAGFAKNFFDARAQKKAEQGLNAKIKQLTGQDLSGLPPELQQIAFKELLEDRMNEGGFDASQPLNGENFLSKLQNGNAENANPESGAEFANQLFNANQNFPQQQTNEPEGLTKQELRMARKNPVGFKANEDRKKEQREAQQEKIQLNNEFKELESLGEYGGRFGINATWGKIPWTEAHAKREELDKLGFLVADKIFVKFNKGVLSTPKFQYVKEELAPNASMSDASRNGRIRALKVFSGLSPDISPEAFNAVADRQIAQIKKIDQQEGKKSSNKRLSLDELIPLG